MTILQKPASINLSGNLPKFIISADDNVDFILKKGEETLMSSVYSPGADNRITVDVRDIVENALSFDFKNITTPYAQSELAADFTASIGSESVHFRCVRAGVDKSSVDANIFLKSNFLTWQPQVKKVMYSSPEYLTLYPVESCLVKVKAYFDEDNEETITLYGATKDVPVTIPVQYAVIVGKFNNRTPSFYDVWAETSSGVRLTYIQRYVASDLLSEEEQWILFENSLGGIDTFRAYGTFDFSGEHTYNIAEIEDVSEEYRIDVEHNFEKNTGYLNDYERRWLLDFFSSRGKYICADNTVRRIVCTDSSAEFNQKELPSSYTFTYRYADAKPYLNLQRFDNLPEVLNVHVPDLGSFTIPPRLVEFPQLNVTEGVLIPAQFPFKQEWGTVTLYDILSYVLSYVYTESGSGDDGNIYLIKLGDTTVPTDYNTFSALRILEEIKKAIDDNDVFIRKDREDSSLFLLSLLGGVLVKKNLKVGDFITGVIGALIDEIGNAEVETLYARKKIFTPEMAYNRITYVKGKWVVSPGGGCTIDEVVDNGDGTWTVKPDLTEADGLSQFKGDILSTYFVTKSDEGKLTGFEEMKFRVESADYTEKTFVLTAKPDTDWVPQSQMVLAQGGNFTDPDRQSYTVIEAVNGNNCITFFEHANTWDTEPAQMEGWLGKKKGMTVQGINCDNYSAVLKNLLMIGTIFQIDEITGESVRVPIWKGEWQKDTKYGYYNEVSHNGSRYLCVNPAGTEQEPGTGNHWMVTVEKGEQGTPGLSVVGGGDWDHTKVPYAASTIVSMYNCVFCSKKETSNPPLAIARYTDGTLIAKPGGYILAGKSDDLQVNEDWDMILDGRELKGESITFLGRFDTAPSDPNEGDSYYNTNDKVTYIYRNGVWMIWITDGKDGKGYEYIFRRTTTMMAPDKPDSQNVDEYVPEGWTDDPQGVTADFQLEWCCKRTKTDGVWSEFSTPAPAYRWAKDGESNVLADLDNEMVSCALTYDGKATKAQSWVTNIGMWYGLEQLTLESITYKDNGVFTVSANKQTGAVTVSVTSGASVPDTTNIRLTLMALKNGQQYSRELVFSIAGVRAGSDGSDAVLYSLVPSVSSVKRTASGSYSVASVSCKRQKTVGGTISDTTDGTLKYSLDGGVETTIANGSGISCSSFYSSVKFVFYMDNRIVDVETIPMVIDGASGSDGKGVANVDVYYYLSNSTTSLTGGSWVTNAPQWVDGKYFWTKTVTTYTDGTKDETPAVCISGGKGPTGNGISKIEEQYYVSTSKTSLSGGSWSTTAPSWQAGKYIWTRTAIYYTNGDTDYTSAICAAGQDGIDGSSVVSYGDWSHTKVPIPQNGLVQFAGGSYVAVRETSNPPYPIARYTDGTLIAKRNGGYILAGRSADRQLNVDWVMVVDKPVSNATYWLSSLVSTINFTSSGYPSPSSVLVTCMQSVDGNVSKCSEMYLAARKYDGSTWYAHVSATKTNSLSVPANKGYTQFAVRAYASASDANSWNENYVAELGIGCSFDGSDGRAGSSPYDMGVWKSGTTYYWNESRRDSVIILFSNVYYKFQVRNFGASVTTAPSSATGDTNWEAVGRHESIATDTLFADGANIAGFMFSRQGYNSDGVPYGLLRSQNEQNGQPVFYVNTKTGELYSQKGRFVNIEAQGTFSTKSSGERIVLDFASNSIKFIASDEKNYGTLGFADNNGYRSSYLSMSNNNNEYASIQPGWLRVRAVNTGNTIVSDIDWNGLRISKNNNTRSVTLINDSLTLSDSSNSKAVIIKSDAITLKEGSTQYTGVDGSFTFKDQYEKTVIVYFRKGICYRISS